MTMLARTLRGGQGIVSIEALLTGLTLDLALRPVDGLPYTIYGLLWHIDFGQRQLLSALGREQTPWPPVAGQWPQDVPTQAELGELLASL